MPVNRLFNETTYSFPLNEESYSGDELTSFFVDVCASTLQPPGGDFILQGDVNFGPYAGLLSSYFSSRSGAASTGLLRLANTDEIDWRDSAGTGDLALSLNASDKLQFNSIELVDLTSTQTLSNKTFSDSLTVTGTLAWGSGSAISSSSDVALRDASNTFTSSGGTASNVALNVDAIFPALRLDANTQAADEKVWLLAANGGSFEIGARNDADTTLNSALSITRSADTPTAATFSTTLAWGGGSAISSSSNVPRLNASNIFTAQNNYFGDDGTNGYIRLTRGDTTHSGQIEFYTPDNVRQLFLGYAASGGNAFLQAPTDNIQITAGTTPLTLAIGSTGIQWGGGSAISSSSDVALLDATNVFQGSGYFGQDGTNGYLELNKGTTARTGYVGFYTPDGVRHGYVGFSSATANLYLDGESSTGVQLVGGGVNAYLTSSGLAWGGGSAISSSSDVALTNVTNTFTASQTIETASDPYLRLSNGALNNYLEFLPVDSGYLQLTAASGSSGIRLAISTTTALQVDTSNNINIYGGTITSDYHGVSAALALASGDNNTGANGYSQISFAYDGAPANYRHTIRTRHNGGADAQNAIDFYTWQSSDAITAIGSHLAMSIDTANGLTVYNGIITTGAAGTTTNLAVGDYSSTNGGQILINGTTANKQAVLKCTNGNLHLDSNAGSLIYLNYYGGSGVVMSAGDSTEHYRFTSGYCYMNGHELIHDANDGWLRFNSNGDYTNGMYTPHNLRVDGSLYVSSSTWLTSSGTALKVNNGSGYGLFGPQNTSWCHMETDRANFYFNKAGHFAGACRVYTKGVMPYYASASYSSGSITVSTSAPSGGSSGDLWFKV